MRGGDTRAGRSAASRARLLCPSVCEQLPVSAPPRKSSESANSERVIPAVPVCAYACQRARKGGGGGGRVCGRDKEREEKRGKESFGE